MKLSELALWLEGKESTQVNWRLDPKNLTQVLGFVDEYAATVGGTSASVVLAKIKREKQKAENKRLKLELAQRHHEALVDAIRDDFIDSGGKLEDFAKRQKEIIEKYAVTGRSRGIIESAEREKRSQAARTF